MPAASSTRTRCPECQEEVAEDGLPICPCGADLPLLTRFRVVLTGMIEFSIEVDAEDEEAAIDIAFAEKPRNLCGSCEGWSHPWKLTIPDDDACWEVEEIA